MKELDSLEGLGEADCKARGCEWQAGLQVRLCSPRRWCTAHPSETPKDGSKRERHGPSHVFRRISLTILEGWVGGAKQSL